MADYRAIEAASRTLRTLLRDRMQEPVPVTLLPPEIAPADVEGKRVNLYLFEVKEQPQFKNQPPPGTGQSRPPLSLELFYLLTTVFPAEDALEADLGCQRMLGDALGVLHEWPIVTAGLLTATARDLPAGSPVLSPALLDERGSLKITLHPAGLEDLSRIWTALPEGAFRRAVVLAVSLVQIAPRTPQVLARPVLERRLIAATGRRPVVESVFRKPALPGDPVAETRVVPGDAIVVRGQNLRGRRTLVRLGALDPIAVVPDGSGERLEVVLPDDTYPAEADPPGPRPIPLDQRLAAGMLTVQVIVEASREAVTGGRDDRGSPVTAEARLVSNLGLLQLLPEVTGASPASATLAEAAAPGAVLVVTGARLFRPGATSQVLLGDLAFAGERVDAGPGQPWRAAADRVAVPLAAIAKALPTPAPGGDTYPLRAIVDGALSAPGPAVTFRLDP